MLCWHSSEGKELVFSQPVAWFDMLSFAGLDNEAASAGRRSLRHTHIMIPCRVCQNPPPPPKTQNPHGPHANPFPYTLKPKNLTLNTLETLKPSLDPETLNDFLACRTRCSGCEAREAPSMQTYISQDMGSRDRLFRALYIEYIKFLTAGSSTLSMLCASCCSPLDTPPVCTANTLYLRTIISILLDSSAIQQYA